MALDRALATGAGIDRASPVRLPEIVDESCLRRFEPDPVYQYDLQAGCRISFALP